MLIRKEFWESDRAKEDFEIHDSPERLRDVIQAYLDRSTHESTEYNAILAALAVEALYDVLRARVRYECKGLL